MCETSVVYVLDTPVLFGYNSRAWQLFQVYVCWLIRYTS